MIMNSLIVNNVENNYNSFCVAISSILILMKAEETISLLLKFFIREVSSRVHLTHFRGRFNYASKIHKRRKKFGITYNFSYSFVLSHFVYPRIILIAAVPFVLFSYENTKRSIKVLPASDHLTGSMATVR